MIVRVQFQKGEEVKYVGHLDTMRTFVRCLKRTNIPVEYSKGFNPRIQISFALPLGVGMTSDSEYFDLVLSAEMNPQMFLAEFNSVLPMGFHVTSAKYIKENKKSLMSLVKEAKYEILLDTQCSRETIEDFFHQSEIVFQKEEVVKGKRKETKINLKPMIISYEIKEQAKHIRNSIRDKDLLKNNTNRNTR